MLKRLIVCILLYLPLLSFSQDKSEEYRDFFEKHHNPHIPLISIDSFKKVKNKVVLDTRENEEFEVSHLKNARNVGYIWFDMRDVYDIPKLNTVVIYSATGRRGEKIAEKLIKAGYQKVYCLYGSLFEWVNSGNPVYTSDGVQTTEVHIYEEELGQWLTKGSKVY